MYSMMKPGGPGGMPGVSSLLMELGTRTFSKISPQLLRNSFQPFSLSFLELD